MGECFVSHAHEDYDDGTYYCDIDSIRDSIGRLIKL